MIRTPSDEFDPSLWLFLQSVLEADDHVMIRNRSGMSLATMAKLIGVTPQAVGHWEAGRRRPQVGPGMRYARVLLELESEMQIAALRRERTHD